MLMKASGVILEIKVVVVEPDSVVWEIVGLEEWFLSTVTILVLRDMILVVALSSLGEFGVVEIVVVYSATCFDGIL